MVQGRQLGKEKLCKGSNQMLVHVL